MPNNNYIKNKKKTCTILTITLAVTTAIISPIIILAKQHESYITPSFNESDMITKNNSIIASYFHNKENGDIISYFNDDDIVSYSNNTIDIISDFNNLNSSILESKIDSLKNTFYEYDYVKSVKKYWLNFFNIYDIPKNVITNIYDNNIINNDDILVYNTLTQIECLLKQNVTNIIKHLDQDKSIINIKLNSNNKKITDYYKRIFYITINYWKKNNNKIRFKINNKIYKFNNNINMNIQNEYNACYITIQDDNSIYIYNKFINKESMQFSLAYILGKIIGNENGYSENVMNPFNLLFDNKKINNILK